MLRRDRNYLCFFSFFFSLSLPFFFLLRERDRGISARRAFPFITLLPRRVSRVCVHSCPQVAGHLPHFGRNSYQSTDIIFRINFITQSCTLFTLFCNNWCLTYVVRINISKHVKNMYIYLKSQIDVFWWYKSDLETLVHKPPDTCLILVQTVTRAQI